MLLPLPRLQVAEFGRDVGARRIDVGAQARTQVALKIGDVAGDAFLGALDAVSLEGADVDLVDVARGHADVVHHQDVVRLCLTRSVSHDCCVQRASESA